MRPRMWIAATGWTVLCGVIFATQLAYLQGPGADLPPPVGDIAEVFNLGFNLAHGRGYRLDWNDPVCRDLWAARDVRGDLRFFTIRRGSHPAMERPPLMPLALAAMLTLHPAEPFRLWKQIDAALFSVAVTLLVHGVLYRFGWVAAATLLPLALLDSLRIYHIPGMWTEGLAFDGMAVLAWMAMRHTVTGVKGVLLGGITIGLLGLNRAMFVLLLPLLCLVLAPAGRTRWKPAALMMVIALSLQLPWWTRNVVVAHRFVPLGSQGGTNLPDEYSDEAVRMKGLWTGHEMTRLWAATAVTPAEHAYRSRPEVLALWPGQPDFAALIHAINCESLTTELAVADVGQQAALRWIRSHPSQLPGLFDDKLITQTTEVRGWLATLTLLSCGTLLGDARRRRAALRLALLVGVYAVGVGLTHAVVGRFVVPVLPPLYALAAGGAGEVLRRVPLLR